MSSSFPEPTRRPLDAVATCALGLEPLVAEELRALGLAPETPDRGGVGFRAAWPDIWRANLELRTAQRVLVTVDRFALAEDRDLERAGRRLLDLALDEIALGTWFVPERSFAIAATISGRSPVRDTRWAAQLFKDGLVDRQREIFGDRRASVDRVAPDFPLRLRLRGEEATVLLDTSGDSLDRRGYRELSFGAPARETLAAAVVLATGWNGQGPIVDPMCGTGTLLAEAAWIALDWPPSALRPTQTYAIAHWPAPAFDAAAFAALRRPIEHSGDPVRLFGGDVQPDAMEATRVNLTHARVAEGLDLRLGRAEAFERPEGEPGVVLINPPYGERLATDNERWRALGDLLKRKFGGYRAAVLAGGEGLGKEIGLRPRRRLPVKNGPLEARILVFDLY